MKQKNIQTATLKKSRKNLGNPKGKKTLSVSARKSSKKVKASLVVELQNKTKAFAVRSSEVRKILLKAASHLNLKKGGIVSVVFVRDAAIKRLNAKYRGKDKPTDVLSFPMNVPYGSSGAKIFGDIVISLERAKIQSKEYKVTLYEEVCRLLIHGFLHLLGYDHEGVSRKKAEMMRRKERMILAKVLRAGNKQ